MMNEKLRKLPKVDGILEDPKLGPWIQEYGRARVVDTLRRTLEELRQEILQGESFEDLTFETLYRLGENLAGGETMHFRRVINATGVVLHTNLGRAVLSEAAVHAVVLAASGYSNLELDLETGERGSRYSHVEELLKDLTGAEDALVVNNNAAAVLLALDTLAKGGETIVSRGELVEIGGSFRVPEVMKLGGTDLVEVGTTNKTHLRDYEGAIGELTRCILKVHTSNYRIVGFSQEVPREELVRLGRQMDLPVIEDLGSGFLADLGSIGITDEPRVRDVVTSGVDVVTFSGDKLLGGPQCGIIVGKKKVVGAMKKNQLTRALRIDKLNIAALEATLRAYYHEERVREDNPTLKMLCLTQDQIKEQAIELSRDIGERMPRLDVSLEEDVSRAGGGSLPLVELPTWVIKVSAPGLQEERWCSFLRKGTPALLTRRRKEALLLDVRTLFREQWPDIVERLFEACEELLGD